MTANLFQLLARSYHILLEISVRLIYKQNKSKFLRDSWVENCMCSEYDSEVCFFHIKMSRSEDISTTLEVFLHFETKLNET